MFVPVSILEIYIPIVLRASMALSVRRCPFMALDQTKAKKANRCAECVTDEICHQPKPYRDGVAFSAELWSKEHH